MTIFPMHLISNPNKGLDPPEQFPSTRDKVPIIIGRRITVKITVIKGLW